MRLTLEQIKSVTIGAVNVRSENGYFAFDKCTDKQCKVWGRLGKNLGPRSRTTTGVRLDFYTDSPKVSFFINSGDRFEIYIDGLLTSYYVAEDLGGTVAVADLDGKEHRVTFIFPSHSVGTIKAIELLDESKIRACEYKKKMLFFGDSITQGWNSKWDSLSYAYIVSRHFDANSIIQGIGGAIFHEDTFDEDIEFEPDIVIIAYGTNDWGYYPTMKEARDHLKAYLNKATQKYSGKKIFAISPIWRGDTKDVRAMGDFDSWCQVVKEEIVESGLILVDGEKLMPHDSVFFEDGFLHPHDLGFAIYAENLIKEIGDKI